MLPYNIEYLQVQPPLTEAPLSVMPVSAFEVGASSFALWRYVPTAASFVRDERKMECLGDMLDELRVLVDGC